MFVMTTHWLSCHKLKMKLENIFGDHIKKKCTALLGFIWVRWRDRRPGLLLNIANPGHPGFTFLFMFLLIFLPMSS